MEKFIPYEKLSKKKQREIDRLGRSTWAISPVTRKPENSKAYNRRKAQSWKKDSGSVLFLSVPASDLFKLIFMLVFSAKKVQIDGKA